MKTSTVLYIWWLLGLVTGVVSVELDNIFVVWYSRLLISISIGVLTGVGVFLTSLFLERK